MVKNVFVPISVTIGLLTPNGYCHNRARYKIKFRLILYLMFSTGWNIKG
jgi:hypothetical protein